DLAAVVSAVGTGGTIRGVSDSIKSKSEAVKIIAVEPALDAAALTGIHNFTEVPEERVPIALKNKIGIYDEVLIGKVDTAFEAARTVAKTDGVLVGNSSGAALWGATEIAKRPEFEGKNIVVIFPDTGLRYLSTDLFNV
ncbi:MAG: pyridoxal-phosphate dependent enzyme, partial [Treponema sp.]|nr:pyridoxal-phosphate dependent enzyme [Treponema sp.]